MAGIHELLQEIEGLSLEDLQVLENLDPKGPVYPADLASELFALPKDIYISIEKLKALSFVEEIESPKTSIKSKLLSSEQPVVLTDTGLRAQALTNLKQESSNFSLGKSTPKSRYKK